MTRICVFASLGVFCCGLITGARGELDLSPQVEEFNLEGVKMSQLAFANGARERATYQPPAAWKYYGTKESLDLLPPSAAQAKAKINWWPGEGEITFDPESCKELTQQFIRMLPEGSEEVKVEAEELSPLQINTKPTYLVELSYAYYGARFRGYFLLLQRKPEALAFRLMCRAADYEKLRGEFQRSLFTWQNL